MNNVHQHPDGWIFVRTDGGNYMDTPENFYTDFGVEFPPLPEGAIERIYDPGKRHVIHGEEGVMGGGDMPWVFGDDLIARVQEGLASQAVRREAEALLRQQEQDATFEARRKESVAMLRKDLGL